MQANGLWSQLAALKKVVTEPKGTGEAFDTVMKDYYTAIKRGQGGLFMAVCRGKVCIAAWDDLQKIRSCKPCRM
jgi:Fanconi anemia group J protein